MKARFLTPEAMETAENIRKIGRVAFQEADEVTRPQRRAFKSFFEPFRAGTCRDISGAAECAKPFFVASRRLVMLACGPGGAPY